jgi:alanyl-tRNA synthetase
VAEVTDTKKPLPNILVHHSIIKKGSLWVGDEVQLKVNEKLRQGAETHHSATHILHAVLREVLGTHVGQAGSLVAPGRLRFDFTHHSPVEEKQVSKIEDIINERIRWDDRVVTESDVPYDEAIKRGAMAFFQEKYGDKVRVVTIGDYSRELCGGTHLESSGEAGVFKIVSESASSAGVRRIEAVSGESAWNHMRGIEEKLREASKILRVPESDLIARLVKLVEENESVRKELEAVKGRMLSERTGDIMENVREINGLNVLSVEIPEADPEQLRKVWDDVRNKLRSGIAVLGTKDHGKAYILVGVTSDLHKKYHSGNIVKELAPMIGGKGGGRPDMAQAGGSKPENLRDALDKVFEIVGAA